MLSEILMCGTLFKIFLTRKSAYWVKKNIVLYCEPESAVPLYTSIPYICHIGFMYFSVTYINFGIFNCLKYSSVER